MGLPIRIAVVTSDPEPSFSSIAGPQAVCPTVHYEFRSAQPRPDEYSSLQSLATPNESASFDLCHTIAANWLLAPAPSEQGHHLRVFVHGIKQKVENTLGAREACTIRKLGCTVNAHTAHAMATATMVR